MSSAIADAVVKETLPSLSSFVWTDLFSLQWWLTYLLESYEREPIHVIIELLCVVIIIYLATRTPYDPRSKRLSKREEDALIKEWQPEPLCPQYEREKPYPLVESATGAHVVVDGRKALNFAATNFLGLADDAGIKAACKKTIDKYGVGSCGPRGFYGSIDTHLDVEKEIAAFTDSPEAILYADSIACVSSVIPAFCKEGDLIVCDEGVHFGVQQGLQLSRANILYFKHNDMDDLESVLLTIREKDAKRTGNNKPTRRFIVVEGIYRNYGDLAPLRRIVALKAKYQYRLILDDTLGFGVLGDTGRGSVEHHSLYMTDIEVMCAGMDTSLATVGGFCVGSHRVVDHQRLSGAGYVFSASSPPYACVAGVEALRLIDREPERGAKCRAKAKRMRELLAQIPEAEVKGDLCSPIIHVRLKAQHGRNDAKILETVSTQMQSRGIYVMTAKYIPKERAPPRPSLRVLVTSAHEDHDIDQCAAELKRAFRAALR